MNPDPTPSVERELEIHSRLLLDFVEKTGDLVTIVDAEGRLLYVNQAAEEIFGLSPEECVGLNALDFVHEDDREGTREALMVWTRAGSVQPISYENRQVSRDGSVRDMLWTILPGVESGEVTSFVSCAKDVSERRGIEDELMRSERRLRALLSGMLDAVITIDPYGIVHEVSDSVEEIFGWRPSELRGQNIKVLMPEPHYSEHDNYLAKYRATGETWILNTTREFEVLRKDGGRIICELSVARIDIPGWEDPLFCGNFRDVTSRKEAERRLAESEQRFRAIFEGEFQYVGLLDSQGVVLEANRTSLESAGLGRGDVVGKPFWETSWWSHSDASQEQIRSAVRRAREGETVRCETEYLARDGELRTVDFSVKPIFENGEVVLLIPEGRDITQLKRAQHRETAMLKALAKIGESAAVLAHEIKNPITAVNVALRAVASQLGEDQKAVLEELSGRMKHLEHLMTRTLSFAKALKLEVEDVAVDDLLRPPVATLRPKLLLQSTELVLDVESECPQVRVDPHLIQDVIVNLVKNAAEALEQGGQITLAARCFDAETVELVVEDDGPGIQESMLGTLFQPFVTSKEKGTGLGLAVCQKVVEEHGGTIQATNGGGGGARFVLHLPSA